MAASGGRLDGVVGEAGELGLVGDVHGRRVGLGQQGRAELRGRLADLLVELAQRRCWCSTGSAAPARTKSVWCRSTSRTCSSSRPRVVPRGVHGVDPGEEVGVEQDRVVVGGPLGHQLALELLHLRGGHRAGHLVEDPHGPVQQPARALQRLDGVGEGRRLVLRGDRRDLGAVLRDALVEGRPVVLVTDRVERREGVGQGAGCGERVAGIEGHGVCSTYRSRACRRVVRLTRGWRPRRPPGAPPGAAPAGPDPRRGCRASCWAARTGWLPRTRGGCPRPCRPGRRSRAPGSGR